MAEMKIMGRLMMRTRISMTDLVSSRSHNSKEWTPEKVGVSVLCIRQSSVEKVGQAPVQKIIRNGRPVTIFTVGTGGMFDQRTAGTKNLPRPAQWHRIAVHSDTLGVYAVQQLAKNSAVYVEGDFKTRVYNDNSIGGEVKTIPEICVRRDGRIRLVKSGETVSNAIFDDLREGLFNRELVRNIKFSRKQGSSFL